MEGVAVSLAVASVANSGVSSSSLGLFRPLTRVALSTAAPTGRDMFVCAGLDEVDAAAAADRGWGGGAELLVAIALLVPAVGVEVGLAPPAPPAAAARSDICK